MWPHEFEYLWLLRPEIEGRQTAAGLAEVLNRPHNRLRDRTPTEVSNQLRRLVADGYVVGDGFRPQVYTLTEKGRAYVDA